MIANLVRNLKTWACAFPLVLAAQPALAEPGKWQFNESSSALTHAVTMSAVVDSAKPLINMVGASENSSLVLRCSDRTLALYVNWPEVPNYDSRDFFTEQPETLAIWRIDDGAIKNNYWTIADGGTAAGEFGSRGAAKLLTSMLKARLLVVRISGRMTQEAIFDLTGIDELGPRIAGACGITLRR